MLAMAGCVVGVMQEVMSINVGDDGMVQWINARGKQMGMMTG